jgi:predicted metal-dependent phosphoesterase TrpH/ABC-type lipoprotein export system ATPase subunit
MAKTVGSKFYKIDFHIHTPCSSDYKDKSATPEDVIDTAIKAGLDAILIADHNSPEWIEKLRTAAKDKPIKIFPGFEINAQGGHILALFDPEVSIATVETALIEAGLKKNDWGKLDAVGKDLESVFHAIASNEGIVIAAHVDGPKGFLTALDHGAAKIKIFKENNLSAIELLDLTKKDDYVQGKISGYDRPIACIQGSDAHSLVEIGSKYTLVRMHHISAEGIRLAFFEPHIKIKFPSEVASAKYPSIEKMVVTQGFLAGQEIIFNRGLNSLVGGSGSGKSTIIEFLRFALDQVSTNEDIRDDCLGKVRDLGGLGTKIHVVANLENGEQIAITRTFDGQENRISVIKYPSREPLANVDVKKIFPILAYSQGEAISISRDRLAQLELIDKHLDLQLSEFKNEIRQAHKNLEKQIPGLITLQDKVNEKDVNEKEIATTQQLIESLTKELEQLEQTKKAPEFLSHHLWVDEKNYLEQLKKALSKANDEINEKLDQLTLQVLQIPLPHNKTPNQSLLDDIKAITQKIQSSKEKARNDLISELSNIEKQVTEKILAWQIDYTQHEAAYNNLAIDESTKRMNEINGQIGELNKTLRNLKMNQASIGEANKTLVTVLKKRQELLDHIKDRKDRIRTLRIKKAKDFRAKIGSAISLKLIPDANIKSYIELATEMMQGSRMLKTSIEQLCASISPIELAKLLRNRDANQIDALSKIGVHSSKKVVDVSNGQPEYILQIEAVELEDFLEISLEVEKGIYRPLEKLSTGQKAVVIVQLSLSEGNQPIIFDQPEDALYTPFIYEQIVKTLLREKDLRQFVLATHNPNIVIGGDTDYSMVLESTAEQTSIKASGGLDDADTQHGLLTHLEGGKEAFIVRQRKLRITKK